MKKALLIILIFYLSFSLSLKGEQYMSKLIMEMVALNKGELPQKDKLLNALNQYGISESKIKKIEIHKEQIIIETNKFSSIIQLIDIPIPWDQLEGPCKTAILWPDAEKMLKKHKAHLIVTLTNCNESIANKYIYLTKIVAALSKVCDTAGIYWGSATLVISKEMFQEESLEMTTEQLPLTLWIDFRIEPRDNKKFILFTTGLESLGHNEIEIQKPFHTNPFEMIDLVFNLAHYLLDNGPIIKDGQTFGMSANQKIKIKFTKSLNDKKKQVMVLNF